MPAWFQARKEEMMGKLFGTDGIRGIANQYPMTPQLGVNLGMAIVHFLGNGNPTILLGRDTRISGPMLEFALASGLLSEGATVLHAGVLPTPGVAYMTREMEAEAGVVISASHNPHEHNGFKIFSSQGTKLTEEEELELERILFSFSPEKEQHHEKGQMREPGHSQILDDATQRYVSFLMGAAPELEDLRDMKIVLDCANGATYRVAPELFQRLNADVVALAIDPDGKNINKACGSQHPEYVGQKVVETGSTLGLAFDGDGDRLVAVDEYGHALSGDQLLVIFAKMLKEQDRLKKNMVVSTVMSNIGLRVALRDLGIEHKATKVGDRNVFQEMLAHGAILGGEESGHILLLNHHSTGDGLLSALYVISAMQYFDRPLSELSDLMPLFPQVLINVRVSKKPPLSQLPEVQGLIEAVEQELGGKGRVLVRYSGTENLCRVMVEGEDENKVKGYAEDIAAAVAKAVAYSNSSDSSVG